ncbi:putative WRKY transcription factor 7 [Abeliophyllum distichum]|uniref:WRKY transcription factor 7 n=1 Tax=Abeliophyllum distichum TaxID=126358 RepID=A0ABD1SBU4_9LAMI
MAVELMPGYRTATDFTSKMEEHAAQEAAAAGLQSVEKLIRLISQSQNQQNFQESPSKPINTEYQAVADVAVNKFKKFISLLDHNRTGHARFRRGPVTNSNSNQQKIEKVSDSEPLGILQNQPTIPQNVCEVREKNSPPGRIYCPTPIQRLPPLPHHHQLARNGSIERKESSTTINFASPANSFMSSLTGDTESLQPSMSSGFQITNLSQVSSAGRPPLSTSSFKRKCSSMDDATAKCGGGSSSSRCHCPKKRKSRVKRVVRIPAISYEDVRYSTGRVLMEKVRSKAHQGFPSSEGILQM